MARRYSKAIRPVEPERKARLTPVDRAGALVARWRTVWGAWVDTWGGADVPGIMTRLKLSSDIAAVITDAERDARRGAFLRALEYLEADRLALDKKCPLPRCATSTQLGAGIRDLIRQEGL